MSGESYSHRSAERTLNAMAGSDDDTLQALSHHHTHRSSSSEADVGSEAPASAAAAAASQYSSYFTGASTSNATSLVNVPSRMPSSSAILLRSPLDGNPRTISGEYNPTAPPTNSSTGVAENAVAAAAAAPLPNDACPSQHSSALCDDNQHSMRSSSAEQSRRSSVSQDATTAPSSCAPSAHHAPPHKALESTKFQLQLPPAAKRRAAAAAAAAHSAASSVQTSGTLTGLAPPSSSPRQEGKVAAFSDVRRPEMAGPSSRPCFTTASQFPSTARLGENSRDSVVNFWTAQASTRDSVRQAPESPATLQRKTVRPRRSRSLPNLKTKSTIDIAMPSQHRLVMPSRVALQETCARGDMRRVTERQHRHHPLMYSQQQTDCQHLSPIHHFSYSHQHFQSKCQYLQPPHYNMSLTPQQSIASGNLQTGSQSTSLAGSELARRGLRPVAADASGKAKHIYVPSLHPPITRQTLQELDLHEILKNPQLRHDVVYDSNVQFRPNFDGERGRRKRDLGNKYWLAIQREIETGCTCTAFAGKFVLPCICDPKILRRRHHKSAATSSQCLSAEATPAAVMHSIYLRGGAQSHSRTMMPSRIPALIHELRVICLSVLPSSNDGDMSLSPVIMMQGVSLPAMSRSSAEGSNSTKGQGTQASASATIASPPTKTSASGSKDWGSEHHIMIAQALDPLLITQQLSHGSPDVAGLVTFIGSILKLHCAPMRDELIDSMISTVCEDRDVTQGLRLCFEILELMKLDIANHQLRSSRVYLVETAVDFETRWFREQIEGKVSFERTRRWFTSTLQIVAESAELVMAKRRTDNITVAFDEGFLRLVFEPPNGGLMAAPGRLAPHISLMSNASLNYACTGVYPETFQFDAFRLLAFHGDVTDITIVYMLLLLFRQLACSPQSLSNQDLPATVLSAGTISENASTLATAQLDVMKSEIWTLLNEAELELLTASRAAVAQQRQEHQPQQASQGQSPTSPSTPTTPRTPATPPGIAGRILGGSMWPGRVKYENSRWRRAVSDIVLQIASRAIRVQVQARQSSHVSLEQACASTSLPSTSSTPGQRTVPDVYMPSDETTSLLVQWLDTNLRVDSPLHRLCSQRLRGVLGALTTLQRPETASRTRKHGCDARASADAPARKRMRMSHGRLGQPACDEDNDNGMDDHGTTRCSASTQVPGAGPHVGIRQENVDATVLERASGLEPLGAEIRVLAERMLKVKVLHLRVFRSVYERMAAEDVRSASSSASTTEAPDASAASASASASTSASKGRSSTIPASTCQSRRVAATTTASSASSSDSDPASWSGEAPGDDTKPASSSSSDAAPPTRCEQ